MIKTLNNKYLKIYNSIIKNAKRRTLDITIYIEIHHITPRSLGGNNLKNNLVKLTAREHYIVHQLLPKFTKGKDKSKMIYAFELMNKTKSNKKRYINSKTYERNKILFNENRKESQSEEFKIRKNTTEYKNWLKEEQNKKLDRRLKNLGIKKKEDLFKIAKTCDTMQDFHKQFPNCSYRYICKSLNVLFGNASFNKIFNKERTLSIEAKEKMRNKAIGRKHSEATKKKIGLGGIGRFYSEETRKKMSDSLKGKVSSMKGRKHSKETILKMKNRDSSINERIGLKNKEINEIKRLEKLGIKSKEQFIKLGKKCKTLDEFRNSLNCEWSYVEKCLKHWFNSSSFYKAFEKEKPLK